MELDPVLDVVALCCTDLLEDGECDRIDRVVEDDREGDPVLLAVLDWEALRLRVGDFQGVVDFVAVALRDPLRVTEAVGLELLTVTVVAFVGDSVAVAFRVWEADNDDVIVVDGLAEMLSMRDDERDAEGDDVTDSDDECDVLSDAVSVTARVIVCVGDSDTDGLHDEDELFDIVEETVALT
jgi:hypothetical protein